MYNPEGDLLTFKIILKSMATKYATILKGYPVLLLADEL